MTKGKSMFYIDRQGRVRYIGRDKKKSSINNTPLVAPRRQKELQFITNQEGKVIPIGGPGAGGGGATGGFQLYAKPESRDEWIEKANTNAPPPDEMYRWGNLMELHDLSNGKRTRSLDITEDEDFYFAPHSIVRDSFVTKTYGRFVLDGEKLSNAGWKRDPGLFAERAWRQYGANDANVVKSYVNAIKRFEVYANPKKYPLSDLQSWMDFRFGKGAIQVVKASGYTEDNI